MNPEPRPFWSLSFRFEDWDRAGRAYERSRDLIFGLDLDASAYRILLNGRAYVVVVGIGLPAASLPGQLHDACRDGEDSSLPDEVIITLALRHEQFAGAPGTRFERRSEHLSANVKRKSS
jgi:hypothetical protein